MEEEITRLRAEKVQFLAEISQLNKDKSQLENDFSETKMKLDTSEKKFDEMKSNISDSSNLKQGFEERGKQIKALKAELEKQIKGYGSIKNHYDEKIKNVEEENQMLKDEIQVKDSSIDSLTKQSEKNETYLQMKINAVNDLHDEISTLEERLSEAKKAPGVLRKIKEIIDLKGFVSDREFKDLASANKKKQERELAI